MTIGRYPEINQVRAMEKELNAIVFDVQRYSLHDGPGIRTIIFLKGCPLKCLWCCNPESQEKQPQVEYYKDDCVGCGTCAQICPNKAISLNGDKITIDKAKCVECGTCADTCPNNALRFVGKAMTAEEVMEQIKSDIRYFRKSGGGITLSGGEPLIWIDFCEEILRQCYDMNIHTAIETTGCVPREYLERIKDYTDLFLYDIKSIDEERHRRLTGVSNQQILSNIRYLREQGKEVIMRIPLIPGCNFLREELESMVELAHELTISEVNIMPYHNLGEVKYEKLFREYELKDTPTLKFAEDLDDQIGQYNDLLKKYHDINVIY